MTASITPTENGPNRVEGPVRILDEQGNLIRMVEEGKTVSLCRCGQSQRKPFCDGSHEACAFEAPGGAMQT